MGGPDDQSPKRIDQTGWRQILIVAAIAPAESRPS
jgi:hypothetical protein